MRYFALLFWLLVWAVLSVPAVLSYQVAALFDALHAVIRRQLDKVWRGL